MCNLQCEQLNLTYMLLHPPTDLLGYLAGFGNYKDLTPEQKLRKHELRKGRIIKGKCGQGAHSNGGKNYSKRENCVPTEKLHDMALSKVINFQAGKQVAITTVKKELAYSTEIDRAFQTAVDLGYLIRKQSGSHITYRRTDKK